MDHKSEFSKWMKTIESALSGETKVEEEILEQGSCGCGAWNCPKCFPDEQNELAGLEGMQIPAVIVIQPEENFEEEMLQQHGDDGQPHGVGMAGTHPVGDDTYDHDDNDNLDVSMPLYGGEGGIEEEYKDAETTKVQKSFPRNADGTIKVGDIVRKFVPTDKDGEHSPLTAGGELEEAEFDDEDPVSYDDAAPIAQQNFHDEMSQIDPDEAMEIIQQITNMQSMGLSKADHNYTEEELASLPPVKLKSIHQQVIGGAVQEATMTADDEDEYRPKQTDQYDPSNFDFGMDLNGTGSSGRLSQYKEPGSNKAGASASKHSTPHMPNASSSETRRAAGSIRPDDEMVSWMRRINPAAGGDETELPLEPGQPEQEMSVRQASDVPTVIGNAMQATGTQSPKWHKISDLPGYRQQPIRGMGRNIFSMFTSTPLEQIKTIANVQGQGPNTDAEMRAVASWLMNNAEDLGNVELDHGEAIPGYRPDVKEYSLDGVRFHVVRDQMGQYIYAYPDADARLNTGRARLGQEPEQQEEPRMLGRNTPRPPESASFSLMEELEWDERIRESIKDLIETEVDEAKTAPEYRKQQSDKKKAAMAARKGTTGEPANNYPVTRVVGKKPGGKKLIDVLHGMQKLSNEAKLEPIPVTTGKDAAQLAWAQFNNNPDDFVIVSGQKGVAGIKPDKASVEKFKATAAKKGKAPNFAKHAGAIRYEVIAFSDNGARINDRLLQPANAQQDDDELDDYQDVDQGPKVKAIKARMGLVHGSDRVNPDNVFNLLNSAIGPITTVWIAGWTGTRGEGNDTETVPQSPGAVERGKMAHRAAAPVAPEMRHDRAFKSANPEISPRGVKKSPATGTPYNPDDEANTPSWYKPKFDKEVDENAMGDAERKSERDKMRYAGQPVKTSKPTASRDPSVNMLFTRLNPVFKRVIDKVAGRTDLRWSRAVEARNHKEASALGKKAEELSNIKNQLESTGVPTLTPAIKSAFVRGLVSLSGANSEYDKEFIDYLTSITQPMPTIQGKTVSGNVANSAKLQDVAKAFERALLAL